MKPTFYILSLALTHLCCSGKVEKAVVRSMDPQQFKLTDTNVIIHPGDFYVSTQINYFFSGIGDENAMDETPYLTESAKLTLDTVAKFLAQRKTLRIRVYFIENEMIGPTYDSCVPCAFEEAIRNYLISKGINEDILLGGYRGVNTKVSEDNLYKIKNTHPALRSWNEYVLLVNEPAQ